MDGFVLVHLSAGLAAFALGCVVLLQRKGTPRHRALGRAWGTLMLVITMTSFWIPARPPHRFNLLHGLSIVIVVLIALAIHQVRRGRTTAHRWLMVASFVVLTGATGAGIFVPGRAISNFLFGEPADTSASTHSTREAAG